MTQTHVSLPGQKHKVIGLVSGGKDSCFNLLHCVANGHEIVALATLTPEQGIDELDSHLYQSVGTRLLPLLAESMRLPLYTRVIKGKAVDRGPEYGSRSQGGSGSGVSGDETEDLTALLDDVLETHPEATALASGAILSNYQRLRIEHVCQRLRLVSLAYLWQSPQLPLLDSMFAAGLEAVIVKVAGEGLGIDVVGKKLRAVRPLLARLETKYGSHPAGEGGEYETLTVDSPLFSKRIKFVESEVVVTDPEPYPVAYLRVQKAILEDKEGWQLPTVQELRNMLRLEENVDALDEASRGMVTEMLEVESGAADVERLRPGQGAILDTRRDGGIFSKRGRWFATSVDGQADGVGDVGEEIRHCLKALSEALSTHGLSLPLHTTHTTLLVSSMSLFAPVNAAYTTFFGTSPPSRATVAVPLPPGQRVKIEIVGFDSTALCEGGKQVGNRQALHVQSLSYWAPANIGPYSQAVHVNSRIHIAGQIPLIPASLTLPASGPSIRHTYAHQAVLALQHVNRIVDVLRSKNSTGGGWTGWLESCTAWWVQENGDRECIQVIKEAWNHWAEEHGCVEIPVLYVRAQELPKGALVEFQVNVYTGRPDYSIPSSEYRKDEAGNADDDDDDDDDDDLQPCYASSSSQSTSMTSWNYQACSSGSSKQPAGRTFVTLTESPPPDLPALVRSVHHRPLAVRCYLCPSTSDQTRATIESWWKSEGTGADDIPCITHIPVLEIRDRQGNSVDCALDLFGT